MRPRYSLTRGAWYRDPDGRVGRYVGQRTAIEGDFGRPRRHPYAILEDERGRWMVSIARLLHTDDVDLADG